MDRTDKTTTVGALKISRPTDRGAAAACLISCLVLLLSVALPPPDSSGRILHFPSICPFHQITGLPCPACGLTRAFVLIGHGAWRSSVAFHPLGWLAYAGFLLVSADGLPMLFGARAGPLLPKAFTSRILWACASATFLAGAVRLISVIFGGAHPVFGAL